MTVELEGEDISRPGRLSCNAIDVGLIVYNERAMIGPTLAALLAAGFDRFIVLDMQSTDGTADYVRDILGDKVQIISFPRRSLIEYGYAEARNTCASFSTRDWLLFVDADEVLISGVENGSVVIMNHGETPDVYSITRKNLKCDTNNDPDSIIVYSTETHNRLYKPNFRIRYNGYIHENIVLSGESCQKTAGQSALIFDHHAKFKTEIDLHHKEGLYALMLWRVYNQPDVRVGIGPWWYDTYVPERLGYIETVAERFAQQEGYPPSFYGPTAQDASFYKQLKSAMRLLFPSRLTLMGKIKRAISNFYPLSK
jgi:glycosyltransferase involved in cell wall biosynthesis